MKPRLYIETTIPSYLVARPSPLIRIAADQQTTREWWDTKRHENDLYISEMVIRETGQGDAVFAAKRLDALAGIPLLSETPETEVLAEYLLRTGIIPPKAASDAFHISLASVHRMEYLLTWNCTHIHNLKLERRIQAACGRFGFTCPLICTPAELLEDTPDA